MVTTTTLDKAGRLVLPKTLRDELQLKPGDSLELESGDGQVTLRPARPRARLRKKRGVWVLHTEGPLPANIVEDTIRRLREEREEEVLGNKR
jgi:AbrB family looped-hinge helix DNA binding protein